MSYSIYKEYRHSGVDWLGEIPRHWKTTKTKFVTNFYTGWTPPTGKDDSYEGENLWANISDLGEKWLFTTTKHISDEAIESSRINRSPKGSLLFSFKLSIGQVSFAGQDMFTNEAIATFLPSDNIDLNYAYYAFPVFLIKNASENIYGAKLLNQELIRSAFLVLPNRLEQITIAAFLDRQTSKIDALVLEQQRLIDLLKEKRQAIISHAITKGLKPDVPMKDSGVEWLGQMPAHWDVKAMKQIAEFINGAPFKPTQWALSGIPIIRIQNLNGSEDFNYFNGNIDNKYFVEQSQLLFGWSGNRGTSFGPHLWSQEGTYVLNQHIFKVLMHSNIDKTWLYWVLKAVTVEVEKQAHGIIGLVHITKGDLGVIKMPLPGEKEQIAIATFLDRETVKIDELIKEAQNAIALLQERRKAIIFAAVTGKIDVRGLYKEKK